MPTLQDEGRTGRFGAMLVNDDGMADMIDYHYSTAFLIVQHFSANKASLDCQDDSRLWQS